MQVVQALLFVCALTLGAAQKDNEQEDALPTEANDVRIPPSVQPSGLPSHILYKNDIKLILPCVASGNPKPQYEWLRNGEVFDLNARNVHVDDTKVGTIRFEPMTTLDEGYYQCRAKNIYGTSVSKVFFLQRATFGRYPPTVIQNYTKKEGMPLKLKCFEIKSIPTPTYTWALVKTMTDENPVSLVPNRRVIRDEDGNLYFSYVTKEDARMDYDEAIPQSLFYKCNVFNSHLDFSTGGSYSRIIVTEGDNKDKPPAIAHSTPSPYIAVKGGEIRIQCIFSGMPEVTVTWDPMPGGRSNTDEYGTVLVIKDVQYADGGRYTCFGTNGVGAGSTETIMVDVQSKPEFEVHPSNMNATEMDTVSVECRAVEDTKPPASIEWFINGAAVDSSNPGPRTEVTDGGQRLTISNLCKDCPGGGSDLKVIQCNASNVHGYVFADGYLNVLLKTVIFTAPEDQHLDQDSTFAIFNCEASSDASTPVTISWEVDQKPRSFYGDERLQLNGTSLVVNLKDLSVEDKKKYEKVYTCVATNGYSTQDEMAKLTIEDGGAVPVVAEAGKMWWLFLILALILLLLILLLCCCICLQRNRGEAYPVDEKERQQGNDPEKECADSGFHDYHRPEDGPVKGSRASLTSTIKLDSDDEGSLAEYGDIDTGKFNEDGSFIGQYMTDKKKKQSNV